LRFVFLLIVGLVVVCGEARAQLSREVSVDRLIDLEDAVSERQGRPVHCLLGYRSCLVYLSRLDGKVLDSKLLGGKKRSAVALVPPYEKKATPKDMSVLLTSDLYRLDDRTDSVATVPFKTPDWVLHKPADQAFYDKVWRDGELNITLSLGYKDQGVGDNPDLFNYSVYAIALDRVHRFANEWNMTWRKVDDLESVAEVRIAPDRLVRLRVIDPHVFCADEQAEVHAVESAIKRDAGGLILQILDEGTFSRTGACARQEEWAAEARIRFMQALSGAHADDIVFYDGHSRHGRGPDFGPFSGKAGKVAPKDLIDRTVASANLAAVYFNGCSGGRNYKTFVAEAKKAGKVVIWNTLAPSMLDADDDLLLFAQGVVESRSLAAIERYLNLTQADGQWPSEVRVDR
jgi:hypothetical protein